MDKWDNRFLNLAKEIASWSLDPSTKVGAVIVRPDRTIASVGYNGFPRGVEDTIERLNDREIKYSMIVHGEMNAIIHAREPLHGYTLYTVPLQPCSRCAAMVIQSGITRAVSIEPSSDIKNRWKNDLELAKTMFDESGVILDIRG